MHIYGIKNCGTVKKALDWFAKHQIPYTFHDFKKEGVEMEKLNQWEKELGWERLLNKKGTTWRKVSPEKQATIVDATHALALLQENTSAIKRPVIETPNGLLLGFNEQDYEEKLLPTS